MSAATPGGTVDRTLTALTGRDCYPMHTIEAWMTGMPPVAIAALVCLIIGLESMGIPLPGEITLVSASLLSVKGIGSPWGVAIAAAKGQISRCLRQEEANQQLAIG